MNFGKIILKKEEIDKKDEKNDGFVRPSFLNLYKNEENSGIIYQI